MSTGALDVAALRREERAMQALQRRRARLEREADDARRAELERLRQTEHEHTQAQALLDAARRQHEHDQQQVTVCATRGATALDVLGAMAHCQRSHARCDDAGQAEQRAAQAVHRQAENAAAAAARLANERLRLEQVREQAREQRRRLAAAHELVHELDTEEDAQLMHSHGAAAQRACGSV